MEDGRVDSSTHDIQSLLSGRGQVLAHAVPEDV